MDELAGRYLTLSLRLGRLRPGLVDSYTGPDRLLAAIHAEPRRHPDALAVEADRLLIDIAGEATLPSDRADWLTRQVLSLRTLASQLSGDHLQFGDRVRRRLDAELGDESTDRADDLARALAGSFPGTGPLGDRIAAAMEAATVAPDVAQRCFTHALTRVQDASRVRFHLPDDESVVHGELDAGRDVQHRWPGAETRTSPVGSHGSRIEVRFTRPVTVREIVAAAMGAAYPGIHAERAIKTALLVEQFGRGENAITLAGTPQEVVSCGAGRAGARVLGGEVEAIVADVAAAADAPSGLAVDDPDIALAITQLRDEAIAWATVAARDLPDVEVRRGLDRVHPGPVSERTWLTATVQDPDRALALLTPVLGHGAVEEFLDKQPSPLDGYRRILTEQLTPSGMRERG